MSSSMPSSFSRAAQTRPSKSERVTRRWRTAGVVSRAMRLLSAVRPLGVERGPHPIGGRSPSAAAASVGRRRSCRRPRSRRAGRPPACPPPGVWETGGEDDENTITVGISRAISAASCSGPRGIAVSLPPTPDRLLAKPISRSSNGIGGIDHRWLQLDRRSRLVGGGLLARLVGLGQHRGELAGVEVALVEQQLGAARRPRSPRPARWSRRRSCRRRPRARARPRGSAARPAPRPGRCPAACPSASRRRAPRWPREHGGAALDAEGAEHGRGRLVARSRAPGPARCAARGRRARPRAASPTRAPWRGRRRSGRRRPRAARRRGP